MIRVLALDTSSNWGGVAIVERDTAEAPPRVLAEAGFDVRDQACHLLNWIDALLKHAGVPRNAIDTFVATHGPGSFTGVRVALGTLRGLAVATGRPCCGVGTLHAMAEAFGPAEADRVPLLWAGRGEVYGASFDPVSVPPRERSAPQVGSPAVVLETAVGRGRAVVFGSGARDLPLTLPAGVRVGPEPRGIAAAAGRLALLSGCSPNSMSPIYVRPPDAQLPR